MAKELVLEQTKLKMLNVDGDRKPDADGYYKVIVGALNVYNNSGAHYYISEGVTQLFAPGSLLQRRVANGCLRAEVNHPSMMPGEKLDDFIVRNADINMKNTCGHFRKVWLDPEFGKKHPEYNNPGMIAIMAEVKPEGMYAAVLKDALENPHANACFSIRSTAEETFVRGRRTRQILEITTFDFVNEGGITVASKWDTPANEAANVVTSRVTVPLATMRDVVAKAKALTKDRPFALESIDAIGFMLDKHFKEAKAPVYHNW